MSCPVYIQFSNKQNLKIEFWQYDDNKIDYVIRENCCK